MKILLIEDSKSSLNLLSQYIDTLGVKPIPAEDGRTGIDLFLKERPDMVLLDTALPDLDGFEVARQIRQLEAPGDWAPIIFLSARNSDQDIERGIMAGGDDYLLTPVSDVVLGAKIRALQRIIQMRQSLIVLARKLDAANQELKRLTALDGLTGIANRRHFDEVLTQEWRRAMRQGSELAILMCDIDFFKQYNDTYGHQLGDDCIQQIASVLKSSMDRGGDLLARYGGEEFIAVLPETSIKGAVFVAEQMREQVSKLNIEHKGAPHGHVTLSFGVASAVAMPETQPRDIVGAADLALYEAKREGRNRVCHRTSLDPSES